MIENNNNNDNNITKESKETQQQSDTTNSQEPENEIKSVGETCPQVEEPEAKEEGLVGESQLETNIKGPASPKDDFDTYDQQQQQHQQHQSSSTDNQLLPIQELQKELNSCNSINLDTHNIIITDTTTNIITSTTSNTISNNNHRPQTSQSPNNDHHHHHQHQQQQQQPSPNHGEEHRAPTSNSSQSGGSINGDQMHTCKLCDKQLSSSSSLDRHMLTHSGERPFKCKRCSMTFTTNGNMHRHMRTHLHKDSLAQQRQQSLAAGIIQAPSSNNNNNNNNENNSNKLPSSKSDHHHIEQQAANNEQHQQQQNNNKQKRRKIRSSATPTAAAAMSSGNSKDGPNELNDCCYDDDATIISSDNDSGCNEDNNNLSHTVEGASLRTPPIKKRKQNHPSYKGSQLGGIANDQKEAAFGSPSTTKSSTSINSNSSSSNISNRINLSNPMDIKNNLKTSSSASSTSSSSSSRKEQNIIDHKDIMRMHDDNVATGSNVVVREASSDLDDDERSESNLTRSDEGEHDNIESRSSITHSNFDGQSTMIGDGHNLKKATPTKNSNFDEELLSVLNYKPLKYFLANDNNYSQIASDINDMNSKEHLQMLMNDEATKLQFASMVAAAAQLNTHNPFINGTSTPVIDQAANKIREQQLHFAEQLLKSFTESSMKQHNTTNEFGCFQCKLTFSSNGALDQHYKAAHMGGGYMRSNLGQSTTSKRLPSSTTNTMTTSTTSNHPSNQSQPDLPWPMSAAMAAALANLHHNLPSTLPSPNTCHSSSRQPASLDDLTHHDHHHHHYHQQHASPSLSPLSPENHGSKSTKNKNAISTQKRKHTPLSRNVKDEEDGLKILINQNHHLYNQTASMKQGDAQHQLSSGEPQTIKRSDSSHERVLWVRSDSQYSHRSGSESETPDIVSKDSQVMDHGNLLNTYNMNSNEVLDDLISNSSRSMSKFEDDNNNETKDINISLQLNASRQQSATSNKNKQDHQDIGSKNLSRKQQPAGATSLPNDSTGSIFDRPAKSITEPVEEIGQNYVKTANPNATRKGGKRNRHCYKCKLCTYSSVDRCTLVRHLRIHSGERPYICMICRYAFTTKANCERHVRKRHKKQYNSLGGPGDGVKGSNAGGRSLIITDHSNHQTIPVKVNSAPAQSGSQPQKTTQAPNRGPSSSGKNSLNPLTRLPSVTKPQTNVSSGKNNYSSYKNPTKLINKGSHNSSNLTGTSNQASRKSYHNNNDLASYSKQDRANESTNISGFKPGESVNRADRNHLLATTKNHQTTLQEQSLSLSTSPASHLQLHLDHLGQTHNQQSHSLHFLNNEGRRLRLPFDTHCPLDLAAQALDLSCKFQPGR